MTRQTSLRRARRQKDRPLVGFIVTWDVDSSNRTQCARVRRFVFGETSKKNGKEYRYSGFLESEGVRYLGQSVLFVTPFRLGALRDFLASNAVNHVVTQGSLGPVIYR